MYVEATRISREKKTHWKNKMAERENSSNSEDFDRREETHKSTKGYK